ncbi:helix-turn-helix domain-containing protein [Acidovorax sp. SUPP950]|uniref:S24 family peptidase n=1 Tax=Acidovorax sp. SUPP950 TaxID=511901 RepID=UPI0023D17FE8|nr:S24 family peptidase [Acidovorax sp. SUPP950]GKS73702.1 helix-turn-helix domain-containing protein [Acidovorax sp. SUPP950]
MQSTLADRVKLALAGPPKKTQKALAKACSVSPPSVNGWVTGESKTIEGSNLISAAAFLGVNPTWLAKGVGPMRPEEPPARADEEFQDVLRIDARLAGGDGAVQGLEEVIGNLKFATSFLRECKVSPAKARVVSVRGHSMHPTIPDGAVVLIDTGTKEPAHDCIFALVRPAEGLIVKRLRNQDGRWLATSDNPSFDPIQIDDGEPISIIGRALWMGTTL